MDASREQRQLGPMPPLLAYATTESFCVRLPLWIVALNLPGVAAALLPVDLQTSNRGYYWGWTVVGMIWAQTHPFADFWEAIRTDHDYGSAELVMMLGTMLVLPILSLILQCRLRWFGRPLSRPVRGMVYASVVLAGGVIVTRLLLDFDAANWAQYVTPAVVLLALVVPVYLRRQEGPPDYAAAAAVVGMYVAVLISQLVWFMTPWPALLNATVLLLVVSAIQFAGLIHFARAASRVFRDLAPSTPSAPRA